MLIMIIYWVEAYIKKSTEALVLTSKGPGLEVTA